MKCLFCNNKLSYKIFDFIIDVKKNDSITDKIYYCKFCPKGKTEKNYFSSLFTARGTGDDIHSYHIRLNRILKNKIICIDVYNLTNEITISLIHYNQDFDVKINHIYTGPKDTFKFSDIKSLRKKIKQMLTYA